MNTLQNEFLDNAKKYGIPILNQLTSGEHMAITYIPTGDEVNDEYLRLMTAMYENINIDNRPCWYPYKHVNPMAVPNCVNALVVLKYTVVDVMDIPCSVTLHHCSVHDIIPVSVAANDVLVVEFLVPLGCDARDLFSFVHWAFTKENRDIVAANTGVHFFNNPPPSAYIKQADGTWQCTMN